MLDDVCESTFVQGFEMCSSVQKGEETTDPFGRFPLLIDSSRGRIK